LRNKRFNQLVERRIDRIRKVLRSKGGEYASDQDRLHNFKVAARIDDETPSQSLWGMFKKHLVSVIDLKNGTHRVTSHLVDEKIGDAINYLILLEALMVEEIYHGMENTYAEENRET